MIKQNHKMVLLNDVFLDGLQILQRYLFTVCSQTAEPSHSLQ
jgi:hypothetical protein